MNKAMRVLVSLLSLFFIFSCSSTKPVARLKKELIRDEEKFSYTDKNGSFLVRMSSGFNKKENNFFTKKSLEMTAKETDNVLEQSIVLSDLGTIKKTTTILRPKISQYSVWFEGKKYFSEIKMNAVKKGLDIKMVSPEAQWNGNKFVKLPTTKSLYCFFSQVVECAKTTGFLKLAAQKEAGSMNFFIIWEGYPYLNETYSDFPSEIISRAQLEYDGKTKEQEVRFNLKVAGQSIFYVIDKSEKMKKMFWVSQGISMVSKLAKKEQDVEKSGEELE